ncbi:hypothetical protein [Haliea sp.]
MLYELFVPVAVAFVGLFGGAIVTLNLRYASNKTEATEALINLGKSTSFLVFRVVLVAATLYLTYAFFLELTEIEEVTPQIFVQLIVMVLTLSFTYLILGMTLLLWLMRKIVDAQKSHIELTVRSINVIHKMLDGKDESK